MSVVMSGMPAGLRAPSMARSIGAVAGRELREAVTSRWFLLYTLAFAGLGLAVSYVSAVGAGGAGLSGFGRTTAGLINLVLLIVPLMGLTAGSGSVASDRERGMLAYLLAQPLTRGEVLLGKFAGLAGALMACIALGLGVSAGVLAVKGSGAPGSVLALAGLSLMLALSNLSVGMLISVLARRTSVATGTAIFAWLALVFATDLGLMAGTMAMRLRVQTLFVWSLANPLQVFKMWSLQAVDASLDVLGPAGLYAAEEYGRALTPVFAGAMAVWTVVPLAVAAFIFRRSSPL